VRDAGVRDGAEGDDRRIQIVYKTLVGPSIREMQHEDAVSFHLLPERTAVERAGRYVQEYRKVFLIKGPFHVDVVR